MTKEQVRTRYFAAYWGCNGTYKNEYGKYRFEIDKHFFSGQFEDNNTFQLKLRPLSAITDEHAVMVAKMIGYEVVEDMQDTRNGFIVDRELPEYVRVAVWQKILNPEDITEWDVSYVSLNTKLHAISDIYGINSWTPELVDTLRSLGYHTGNFMGYDPIAEGWAVLNDKP